MSSSSSSSFEMTITSSQFQMTNLDQKTNCGEQERVHNYRWCCNSSYISSGFTTVGASVYGAHGFSRIVEYSGYVSVSIGYGSGFVRLFSGSGSWSATKCTSLIKVSEFFGLINGFSLLRRALSLSRGEKRVREMENSDKFVQPAIPKFDGHFDHWSLLMENFLRSKEMWGLVENGVPAQTVANPTEPQRKAFEESSCKLEGEELLKYAGSNTGEKAHCRPSKGKMKLLSMKDGEKVNAYLSRTLTIVNKMKANGKQLTSGTVVAKQDDEQALKISTGSALGGRGRGHGGRGGRERGRLSFDKSTIECYNCHKLRHFQNECPEWEKDANYAEHSYTEEMVLMAQADEGGSIKQWTWFFDSGCSNHMTGERKWFSSLDESYRNNVRLGNDVRITVMGKGNVHLDIEGVTHTLIDVYYVPGLMNNLISVGQVRERGLEILIKNGLCSIFHPRRGLITRIKMSSNRMFMIKAKPNSINECHKVETDFTTHLWHQRFGHINNRSLKLLHDKDLVRGPPIINTEAGTCSDCLVGKQTRDIFAKTSSWRETQHLQLVHSNICGPITPQSSIQKRKVPKIFWPEAASWCVHVLNRSPTAALENSTPEEKWSGRKPSVSYFRIFGCLAHVHNPKEKRLKLDDRSLRCVLFRVSKESKAYRLYDLVNNKIVVSKEEASWNWAQESAINPADLE
ncbi:retrovirus-related pol polyprotein from transposon TNT 1-94 [Tanacetum coccineum]